jgi:hypothetical protein
MLWFAGALADAKNIGEKSETPRETNCNSNPSKAHSAPIPGSICEYHKANKEKGEVF